MFVFGNDQKMRGCYATLNLGTAGGKGAYLQLPDDKTIPHFTELGVTGTEGASDVGHPPIIVTGVSFAQKEKYHLIQCFNDHAYAYAFGHDPHASLLEVSFVGFLVSDDGTGWSNVIPSFCKSYKQARLIESKKQAQLYVGSDIPLKGFIVGMSSATADPHHNIQRFNMTLLLTEVQEGTNWSTSL